MQPTTLGKLNAPLETYIHKFCWGLSRFHHWSKVTPLPQQTLRYYPSDIFSGKPPRDQHINQGARRERYRGIAYTFCEAITTGVTPTPFLADTSPPASSRAWSTSGLPPYAGPWTGVIP